VWPNIAGLRGRRAIAPAVPCADPNGEGRFCTFVPRPPLDLPQPEVLAQQADIDETVVAVAMTAMGAKCRMTITSELIQDNSSAHDATNNPQAKVQVAWCLVPSLYN